MAAALADRTCGPRLCSPTFLAILLQCCEIDIFYSVDDGCGVYLGMPYAQYHRAMPPTVERSRRNMIADGCGAVQHKVGQCCSVLTIKMFEIPLYDGPHDTLPSPQSNT